MTTIWTVKQFQGHLQMDRLKGICLCLLLTYRGSFRRCRWALSSGWVIVYKDNNKEQCMHKIIQKRCFQFINCKLVNTAIYLTLSMLKLLSSKAQGCKDFWKPSKPSHVGIHWEALAERSQMSTHLSWFQLFFGFLHHFVVAKLVTSSLRVKQSGFSRMPTKLWARLRI